MIIVAKLPFYDLEEKKHRKEGERWNPDTDRANYLIGIGYAEAAPEKKSVEAPKSAEKDEAEKE